MGLKTNQDINKDREKITLQIYKVINLAMTITKHCKLPTNDYSLESQALHSCKHTYLISSNVMNPLCHDCSGTFDFRNTNVILLFENQQPVAVQSTNFYHIAIKHGSNQR